MDTQTHAYWQEQAEARIQDDLSGTSEAFARHLDRIRQRPDGDFEQRAPNGNWYPYTHGGYLYGAHEVDALRFRGDVTIEDNVKVRFL